MAFSRLSVFVLAACLATTALCADSFAEPRVATAYYASAGESCAHIPCRRGLRCEAKVCKIKKGKSCLGNEALCVAGLVCAGSTEKKRCVRPMPLGGRCGQDPFWVCAAGLDCVNHRCVKPKIPEGGNCLPTGSVCEDGLTCAGTATLKVCVDPFGPGDACSTSPFDICDPGLICEDNVCKTPKNGDCLITDSVCVDGTVCAGTAHKKRCVTPMGLGGQCNVDPFWVCAAGLDCVNHRCVKPKIPEGGDCLPKGSVCEDGLICAGKPSKQMCVKPVAEGGACDGKFAVCKAKLTCRFNKCRDGRADLGGRCGLGRECKEGLVCRKGGRGGIRKTCLRLVGAGEECEIGGEVQCKDGLVCKHGWCDKH